MTRRPGSRPRREGEANEVDLQIYTLADRLAACGQNMSAVDLRAMRSAVRAEMHPRDRAETE